MVLNLLSHPERKEIVNKTIETHNTFVAGPVELIEGGFAFISYTPIFNKKSIKKNDFWGITDIVIKQNSLLNEAKLKTTENGFSFALRGYNGTGEKGLVFWGDEAIFSNNPVTINVNLPIGNWVLAAVPSSGWDQYLDQDKTLFLILLLSVFIISVLIWIISKELLKIRHNEKEMKAILGSLDSLIVEYNIDGDYIKIGYANKYLLFLPEKDLIGKNLSDIFNNEQATYFKNAISKCLATNKMVNIEYELDINEKQHWFSGRITPKNDYTVILNAYDITDKKKQEKLLLQSEQELKKLNEMKDQFFSIIAHDLKNPLGTHKAIIDLIISNYDSMDVEKKLLLTIQESSGQLNNLLENLLKWSMSQSGKIKIQNQTLNISTKYVELFSHLTTMAKKKDIQFINELNPKTIVHADPDLTAIIIRNLVSNSLKFTERNGSVSISSEIISKEGLIYQKIAITDTGVGIHPNKLNSLFRIDKTQSNPGTENEKGSGLELLLCKEFVEKQGGEIMVESTIGKGSVFSFTLPLF